MALVYAVIRFFLIASVHSFFDTFLISGVGKSTEGSIIPACPSLVCFV